MKKRILIIVASFILVITAFYYSYNVNKNNIVEVKKESIEVAQTQKTKEFYIDIKGEVKKPGVYKVSTSQRVIDAIKLAGGLTKNANTLNINLSQKLKSEMVIYVYSDKEIEKGKKALNCDTVCNCEVIEVNNCYEREIENKVTKININLADLNLLMKIPGIGESKAKEIIEYRVKEKFSKKEDIMNISGIGEKTYQKIKDNIEV